MRERWYKHGVMGAREGPPRRCEGCGHPVSPDAPAWVQAPNGQFHSHPSLRVSEAGGGRVWHVGCLHAA